VRARKQIESHGLVLASMHLPLSSAGIQHQVWPNIMLGTPERDKDIDLVIKSIRAAGQAGIKTLCYNLALLPVVRTGETIGRNGVRYSHFDYRNLLAEEPLCGRELDPEVLWERIAYYIERVMPAAEEAGVRLACHQHDPGLPEGIIYRGVPRVLGSLAGVRRFLSLSDSPSHGLNFCQGTIAEMCSDPSKSTYQAIREFASAVRIFWVHFRNIRGGLGCFDEVFPDEGDIDMRRALRTYRDCGYDGVIVPDHMPCIDGDTPQAHIARAYCFGYIRGLLAEV